MLLNYQILLSNIGITKIWEINVQHEMKLPFSVAFQKKSIMYNTVSKKELESKKLAVGFVS